jgi:phosphatidylglycerophosphate synthase
MNLHRASKKADWENVTPSKRSVFQKGAAATGGIVSPANGITVIGLGIVIYGLVLLLQGEYLWGLILLVVGRLLDIADGVVAEATQTKSATGELFDAAADKIGTLLTIVVLIAGNIADWWVIVALILPQVLIPLLVFYKRQKNIRVHPTRQGKVSMALTWVGIAGLILVKALGSAPALAVVTYLIIAVSLLLGLYALWQYATGRNQN